MDYFAKQTLKKEIVPLVKRAMTTRDPEEREKLNALIAEATDKVATMADRLALCNYFGALLFDSFCGTNGYGSGDYPRYHMIDGKNHLTYADGRAADDYHCGGVTVEALREDGSNVYVKMHGKWYMVDVRLDEVDEDFVKHYDDVEPN